MNGQLRNAASDRVGIDTPRYGERDWVASELRHLLADDFVREDHRRLIAVPAVGPDGWIEQLLTLFDLGTGALSLRLDEVVAVRGERLALYWIELSWDGGDTDRRLGIVQYDEEVRLVERYVTFDDLDIAMRTLDDMAAVLGSARHER